MGIHEKLVNLGFVGVGNINRIEGLNKTDRKKFIKMSCTVVVVLHDETCNSEKCQYEWSIAKKSNVPVVCLIDMQHCLKGSVLKQVHATEPYLLSYQMIEYTLKNRRQATSDLAHWLNTVEYDSGDCEEGHHGAHGAALQLCDVELDEDKHHKKKGKEKKDKK